MLFNYSKELRKSMSDKLIFLSHIHEEKELAILLQQAIESEFSGFVTVFVSSDGSSIPIGNNFLNAIKKGLTQCIAAVYLISPTSVTRPWINFELGAVWSRSAISEDGGGEEIPAMPMCHSGITPGMLPQPMCNLNSIEANKSAQLEVAFKSIQRAVGGRGNLRTDFDELANKVAEFERRYTVMDNIAKVMKILPLEPWELVHVKDAALRNSNHKFDITFHNVREEVFNDLNMILSKTPAGNIELQHKYTGLQIGTQGGFQSYSITIIFNASIIAEYFK